MKIVRNKFIKIISTEYIYINNIYYKNLAVLFNEKILLINSLDNLKHNNKNIKIIEYGKNSVLYPGFINTHTHLEFSANKTSLKYGDFIKWLDTIFLNRDILIKECNNSTIYKACQEMLESGITTFGTVSSYGVDLEAVSRIAQKVVFFNEFIGAKYENIDEIYSNFIKRVEESKKIKNIKTAIAVHSPYSVHPLILKKVIQLAIDNKFLLSTHFLESPYEREWLENSSGEFLLLFKKFFKVNKSINNINNFLSSFNTIKTHFIHSVEANLDELNQIKKHNHSISYCPRSNSILGCNSLNLKRIIDLDIKFSLSTDGLSSNYSLNMFDELRAALFLQSSKINLNILSNKLIESITKTASKILNLNNGEIKIGKDADFIIINLPYKPFSIEDISYTTILHTKKIVSAFINGVEYKI